MFNRKLRDFGVGVRLGLTGIVVALLIGFVASALHLYWHYEPRDQRPGLSINDLRSAYHGIDAPALLVESLTGGHPETLSSADRKALLDWLASDTISENYDSLDLGDDAPSEIIAASCISCHARNAPEKDRSIPLEYWDDVKKHAFAIKIEPVPLKIVAVSAHTHALAMAPLTLAIGMLALATAFPRRLTGLLCALAGVALALDLASWWLARIDDRWVYMIAGAGTVYNAASVLMILMVLIELWRPRSGSSSSGGATA